MKKPTVTNLVQAVCLTLVCQIATAAETHAFYVVDARDDGNVVLHTTSPSQPKTDVPYTPFDVAKIGCCFRPGIKPGARKARVKLERDSDFLSADEGASTYQYPGYLLMPAGVTKRPSDAWSLAFGIEGMTGVAAKGDSVFVVSFADNTKPIIVRQCDGTETVQFRLYHSLSEKKPFASYFVYMGYEMEPSCK